MALINYYEGQDYEFPEDSEIFVKAMISCQLGDFDFIKNNINKNNVNNKVTWYSNYKNGKGYAYIPEQSLLSIASNYGKNEIVNYLINQGAKLEDMDEYGYIPLHFAAQSGHLQTVITLVEAGSNINKVSQKKHYRLFDINTEKTTGSGETPLHRACHLGHVDVAKYLLNNGADKSLNIKDIYGDTPIDKTRSIYSESTEGQIEVKKFIENYKIQKI